MRLSPEYKTETLLSLIDEHHLFSPSTLLRWANNAGCLPELLEAKETAYLAQYHSLSNEIDRLIQIDHKDQFASFLFINHDKIKKFPSVDVFERLCRNCAPACAAAFLGSPLRSDVNISEVFLTGEAPLHIAAELLSYGFIDLLLRHRANPEVPCVYGTPLMVALGSFRYHHYVMQWIKRGQYKSYLKLIDLFSSPAPELEAPLDIIKLLASHTKQLEKLKVCLRCIEIGDIIMLGALLFVSGISSWFRLLITGVWRILQSCSIYRGN